MKSLRGLLAFLALFAAVFATPATAQYVGLGLSIPAQRTHVISLLAAPTATATMTQLVYADRIYQRDSLTGGGQGKGQAAIPFSFSAATQIGTVNACLSSTSGTHTCDLQSEWQAGTITSTVGVQNITLFGVDAGLRWGYLSIHDTNGWQDGTTKIGVGDLSKFSGQSLTAVFFHAWNDATTLATLGVDTANAYNQYTRAFVWYQTPAGAPGTYTPAVGSLAWEQPSDAGHYNSAGVASYLELQAAHEGVVQGAIGYAQTSTSQSVWQAGWANQLALKGVIDAAGDKWRYDIWFQGHADSAFGMPAANYASDLVTRYQTDEALNGYPHASVIKVVGSIPNIHSTGFGPFYILNDLRAGSRAGAAAIGGIYADVEDVAETDFVHETQLGAQRMGWAFYRASQNANAGPTIQSVTRVGRTITVTGNSAGTLVPTGSGNTWYQRWRAYAHGSTLSGWTITGGAIISTAAPNPVFTLTIGTSSADDPGDGTTVDLYGFPPYDGDPNGDPSGIMLRDNVTDGDGIGIGRSWVPNTVAYAIPPPNGAGAQNTPTTVGTPHSQFDMVATGGSNAATPAVVSAYNGMLTAGTTITSTQLTPVTFPMAMEGFFVAPSLPSGTSVIQSAGSSYFVAVANISGSTRLFVGYGKNSGGGFAGVNGAAALTAGDVYAYSYNIDTTSLRVYLQDITAATAGFRDINLVGSGATVPNHAGLAGNWQIGQSAGSSKFFSNSSGGAIFHVAFWNAARVTGTTWTASTTPLVGNETNLIGLFRLDNGTTGLKDAVQAIR
jgi:hypothetical protein